jgi:outer membrane receptor protein involved in Fe transport
VRNYVSTSLALVAALFALLGTTALPAHAQVGKVTGVVTDAETGGPLAAAQVYLEGIGRGALTADNGRYFIVNVPPGRYTVVVELIGYQTVRRENVQLAIDITRVEDFELTPEAIAVEEIRVEATRAPLVEFTATGTRDAIVLEDMVALPITSVNEALALRSGFLEVPQNTDIVAYAEENRGLTPIRIRGGRNGETLTLIDGVPINNFVFGGPAFQPTPYAIQQLDFIRGGFEAQYGNALSGIINIATRDGGSELEGALEYRTSGISGALGSEYDELADEELFQGYLAGPVPGTGEKLRFSLAGRTSSGASRVLEFDDQVYNPLRLTEEYGYNQPNRLDLFSGWRAGGYDQVRDVFGKLTYWVTPTAKARFTIIDYQRQTQPFLFDYLLTGFDLVEACTAQYGDEEICASVYGGGGTQGFQDVVQPGVRQNRRLYAVNWDHTLGRTFYKLTVGRFDQDRMTCNWFQGVCLGARFADMNFSENFRSPGITMENPASGSGGYFGGEDLTTWMFRADAQSQVSEHHNVGAGVFYMDHELDYSEVQDRGTNDIIAVPGEYHAEPWDAAVYVQDRIEYDFITVQVGLRFDFGQAGGLFFTDAVDPTNGTTALDVCENPNAWQNVQVREFDATTNTVTVTELSADPSWTRQYCAENRDDLELAARIATGDDFNETSRRNQFSPRLGVSFPVTATSSVFFNYARFSQNPLYNNVFQGTGVGTPREGTPEGPALFASAYTVPFVGNTNLLIEQTNSYEIGYLTELGDDYGLTLVLFSKDQSGLTGLRTGGRDERGNQVFDEGVTYGTNTPQYQILLNQDFTTTRGFEIGFRKRLRNYWAFDLNYQFSNSTTNASEPERQFERLDEGDPEALREITSEIDQPHRFNGVVRFQVGAEAPVEGVLGDILKYSMLSVVVRAASGLPYTPASTEPGAALGFNPDRREINSGRAPSTFQLDMLARKEWQMRGLRYGFFVQAVNVLDTQNCLQVSPVTGRCDSGAFDFLRRRVGNPVGEGTSSTQLDRPNWVGQRRSFLVGGRVAF